MSLLNFVIAMYVVLRNVTELCEAINGVICCVSLHLLHAVSQQTVAMNQP
jgi:hypothetical protein